MSLQSLHFHPEANWMNDPNGLFYLNGSYHLFYQYNPNHLVWGPMHWGHALTHDFITWKHLPIALYPDELGQIFSGSIVVDHHNHSGLFKKDEVGLLAFFTHHKDKHESQSIAYSTDEGISWTQYPHNPVVEDDDLIDFRDPKVFWMESIQKWVMVLACGDHVRFYHSTNLLEWALKGRLDDFLVVVNPPLECPDLFPCKVEDGPELKWILKIDVANHPAHGPGAVCLVGDFNGTTFIPDRNTPPAYVDYGQDFYAAASWSNTQLDQPLWIGWMNNWRYANETPHENFRGLMSMARTISLKKINQAYVIHQHFADEALSKTVPISEPYPSALFIEARAESKQAWTMRLYFSEDQHIQVQYDVEQSMIRVNRQHAKGSWKHDAFKDNFDIAIEGGLQNIQIIIDKYAFELLANEGRYSLSLLHFTFKNPTHLEVEGTQTFKVLTFKST